MSAITITLYDKPEGTIYVEHSGDDSVETPAVELSEAVLSFIRRSTDPVPSDARLRLYRGDDVQ